MYKHGYFKEGGCGTVTTFNVRKKDHSKASAIFMAVMESDDIYDKITNKLPEERLRKVRMKLIEQMLSHDCVCECYVRYYPRYGEDWGMEIEGGYAYGSMGRGAIEVFAVDMKLAFKLLKSILLKELQLGTINHPKND